MSGAPKVVGPEELAVARQRRTTGGPRITAPQPPPPSSVPLQQREAPMAGALEVDYDQLSPDPDQPRRTMDEERLGELAASIRADGLLQPLLVRLGKPDLNGTTRYVVIAGGRRLRAIGLALQLASPEERPRLRRVKVVLSDSPEGERRIIQLIENIQREALPALDEARALQEVMQLRGWSRRQLAEHIHKSHTWVNERLALLDNEALAGALERGQISPTVARELRKLDDAELREELLDRVGRGERLRVADVLARRPARGRAPRRQNGAAGASDDGAVETKFPPTAADGPTATSSDAPAMASDLPAAVADSEGRNVPLPPGVPPAPTMLAAPADTPAESSPAADLPTSEVDEPHPAVRRAVLLALMDDVRVVVRRHKPALADSLVQADRDHAGRLTADDLAAMWRRLVGSEDTL